MNMINHYKNNGKAFSLIELLVALSILAVVAAIIVPRFLSVRENAADTVATAQIKALNNAYTQWQSLGGTLGTGTVANVMTFLTTQGSTSSTTRAGLAATVISDTTGNFGSCTISISGVPYNSTAAAITGSSTDGFLIGNGTPTTIPNGTLVFKSGNRAYPVTFTSGAATPFALGSGINL